MPGLSYDIATCSLFSLRLDWKNEFLDSAKLLLPSECTTAEIRTRLGGLVQEAMTEYAKGGLSPEWRWPELPIRWTELGEFARRVLQCLVQTVGPGSVVEYGALAARAGYPGAARAVGSVMAKNRWVVIVPCHRVVSAGGGMGGYSAQGGLVTKRMLLEHEAGNKKSPEII